MGGDRGHYPHAGPETIDAMIRIVIENIFFFLIPTLVYISWEAYIRRTWPGLGEVLRTAPLLNLFFMGAAMMLFALVAFSSRSHNTPDETYVPPVFEDGKLQPGHAQPANK
jgi:Family of unknown function (DUF6111)